MLNIVLAVLGKLPFWWRIGLFGMSLAGIGGVYGYWHHQVYQSGYQAAIHKIAAQDQEAVDAAAQARARVNDCRNSGGLWDSESGKCQKR